MRSRGAGFRLGLGVRTPAWQPRGQHDCGFAAVIPEGVPAGLEDQGAPFSWLATAAQAATARYDVVAFGCGCNATIYRDGLKQHLNVLPGCPWWHAFHLVALFERGADR